MHCLILIISALLLSAAATPQGFSAEATFERVWVDTRDHLCDAELSSRYFTEANHARLEELIRTISDVSTLADTFNRFIEGLHVSHTRLVTADDLEFYVYGSSWSPRRLDTLEVSHIGIQWARRGNGEYVVLGDLEGYPAERAGLRRGDVILSADGRPFYPLRSFRGSGSCVLGVRRGGRRLVAAIAPVYESPHRSLLTAMRNSVRRIDVGRHHGHRPFRPRSDRAIRHVEGTRLLPGADGGARRRRNPLRQGGSGVPVQEVRTRPARGNDDRRGISWCAVLRGPGGGIHPRGGTHRIETGWRGPGGARRASRRPCGALPRSPGER